VRPFPAFFVSTPRGVAKTVALEVVSSEEAPFEVSILEQASNGLATVEPIEPGHRYKLLFTVPADAPPGRATGRLALKTTSPSRPVIPVGVNTIVRERVYTFPDAVDLGALHKSDMPASGGGPNALAQTLMVYQSGGRDFKVKAAADVPGLAVLAEP